MIPYGQQTISEADIGAVEDVLRSDFLTQGPVVPRFEGAVRSHCGASHAVAVNSATSALHLACLALGLGSGDWLWTSPITFVASANCVRYCGAEVDFVDIDPVTWNMSVDALEAKLEDASRWGGVPKIVVPVHLCGAPCDMERIYELSKKFGFRIIEDASHAIGAEYQSKPIGDCRYSDVTVFSFHPVKIITSAEGGMAVTNDEILAKKMTLLRSHGITREAVEMLGVPDGPWYYEQIDLGYNYRMTDVHAALGLSQMSRLDEFVASRRMQAKEYDRALCDLPLQLPLLDSDGLSSWHLYVVRLKLNEIALTHRECFERLRQMGIGVNLHYMPVYRQPYYRQRSQQLDWAVKYPSAEAYYAEAITLPLYPGLGVERQARVVDALQELLLS